MSRLKIFKAALIFLLSLQGFFIWKKDATKYYL